LAKLSVVAPFYNESASATHFAGLLRDFARLVEERFGLGFQAVLVDDGSTDDSAKRFSDALAGDWKIVRLSRNFGKEVALLAGLDHADGDFVMLMDADLQHSLETALVDGRQAGRQTQTSTSCTRSAADRREDGWRRTQLARLFYKLINWAQRFEITANSGDFRVMRRSGRRGAHPLARHSVASTRASTPGRAFRQEAVPYAPLDRVAGKSKWSRFNLIALSIEGFTSFTIVPLRIMSLVGLLLAGAGVIYGIKIILEVVFYGIAVPGFPSILVAVVVLGGFNLALLGMLGEYLWVAVSEVKDRPVYLVRDVVEAPAATPVVEAPPVKRIARRKPAK
jgi:glycosyltransferase involved in cell wall biosynthesis